MRELGISVRAGNEGEGWEGCRGSQGPVTAATVFRLETAPSLPPTLPRRSMPVRRWLTASRLHRERDAAGGISCFLPKCCCTTRVRRK